MSDNVTAATSGDNPLFTWEGRPPLVQIIPLGPLARARLRHGRGGPRHDHRRRVRPVRYRRDPAHPGIAHHDGHRLAHPAVSAVRAHRHGAADHHGRRLRLRPGVPDHRRGRRHRHHPGAPRSWAASWRLSSACSSSTSSTCSPRWVTGTVIFTIGLSLYPIAIRWMAGGEGAPDFGSPLNWFIALVTLVVVFILTNFTKGILSQGSLLFGIIIGTIVSIPFGMLDLGNLSAADGSRCRASCTSGSISRQPPWPRPPSSTWSTACRTWAASP